MKNKFATIDLFAVLHDLQPFVNMRVTNVYDIDSRTYLLKLQRPEQKAIILFESGARIHQTTHDWPKSQLPSQFSMKFRKHINQKRLISIKQLGVDRIVDMQFGEEERACHVIVEIYDRGNIILTDNNYIILNVLRPRTDKDTDVRFSVREKYQIERARQSAYLPSEETIGLFLNHAKKGDILRKALIKHVPFSSALLDHALISVGLPADCKIGVDLDGSIASITKVKEALKLAEEIQENIHQNPTKGYICYQNIQLGDGTLAETYHEYHPYDFVQFTLPTSKFDVHEYSTFSEAIDKFYSVLDEQKGEQKALAAEKQALKKLDNVKKDHEIRVKQLDEVQSAQTIKGERIEVNRELVDQCLLLMRTAIANKMTWDQIREWLENLAKNGIEASKAIVKMDLKSNEVTLRLSDPYDVAAEPITVDIDIDLSSSQNSRKYFTDKKNAAEKQQKTLAASTKALKSAQMHTKNKIDQVRAHTNLLRARKVMWFEKFYWFISSDKYLVIAGRDFQQNEQLVKRYLRAGDIYVHADIHGACSVVIRNKSKDNEIPPKTLNEAGTLAICYSSAWEAKVVINAWWVRHDQVSRTAPTGEYLPAGSFMIRGKKNYIPASQLQLGFGLLFRLDEESAANHKAREQEAASVMSRLSLADEENVQEAEGEEGDDDEGEELKDEEEEEQQNEDEKEEAALEDVIEEEQEEEEADEDEFPDVELNEKPKIINAGEDTEYTMVQFPQPQRGPRKVDPRQQYLEEKKRKEQEEEAKKKAEKLKNQTGQISKRQKHKLDKIKKKYKDQTEEEREYNMELLGHKKPEEVKPLQPLPPRVERPKVEKPEQPQQENEEDDEEDPEASAEGNNEDELVIQQLCARTFNDDSLIYTVAVCAPYSSMQKFKYKVKITPGTGKRGKAAKMALQLFLRDKSATPAELNLIKGLVSDNNIASNIPGKVRVSAPQLLKMKK
uniref:Uncharacterized protein n=1 Tax=Panagrolaimus sp. ES5 TaxID=591445 RepID=A0AC34FTK1_9BILA